MKSIVSVWVDAAMRLDTRDLRMMARLVRAQDKLQAHNVEEEAVERLFAPVRRRQRLVLVQLKVTIQKGGC
jgi:hypothetical protein